MKRERGEVVPSITLSAFPYFEFPTDCSRPLPSDAIIEKSSFWFDETYLRKDVFEPAHHFTSEQFRVLTFLSRAGTRSTPPCM